MSLNLADDERIVPVHRDIFNSRESTILGAAAPRIFIFSGIVLCVKKRYLQCFSGAYGCKLEKMTYDVVVPTAFEK